MYSRGGSTYGPNRHRPPFWKINHANSAYFRLFWAIFGLYQPPDPPFYISWIHPCTPYNTKNSFYPKCHMVRLNITQENNNSNIGKAFDFLFSFLPLSFLTKLKISLIFSSNTCRLCFHLYRINFLCKQRHRWKIFGQISLFQRLKGRKNVDFHLHIFLSPQT